MQRTQNFVSPDARGSGTSGNGTNAKLSEVQLRVVLVRTQNFFSPDARGSVPSGNGTKAKFLNSSRAW